MGKIKELQHQGFTGRYNFESDENQYYGKLIDIKDLVTFCGNTTIEVKKAFIEAVDDYLYIKKTLRLNELMDAKIDTPEGDELKALAIWIQDYEENKFDIPELTQKEIDDYEAENN